MSQPIILAIDLGGTHIRLACVSSEGQLSHWHKARIDYSSWDTALASLYATIDAYLANLPVSIDAIGFSAKGLVDSAAGIWLSCSSIPGLWEVPITQMLTQRYRVPAYVDNDVHAATLAERLFGAGRTYTDFVYYNIGTGIAAGIIAGGQLFRGAQNLAGELGLTLLCADSPLSPHGPYRDLEYYASGKGIISRAQARLAQHPDSALAQVNPLTSTAVFELAQAGDPDAQAIAQGAVDAVCHSCLTLINLLNPQAIIFGGGVMTDGYLLPRVEAFCREYIAWRKSRLQLEAMTLSPLGSQEVGVLGGAAVALYAMQR